MHLPSSTLHSSPMGHDVWPPAQPHSYSGDPAHDSAAASCSLKTLNRNMFSIGLKQPARRRQMDLAKTADGKLQTAEAWLPPRGIRCSVVQCPSSLLARLLGPKLTRKSPNISICDAVPPLSSCVDVSFRKQYIFSSQRNTNRVKSTKLNAKCQFQMQIFIVD